ncbi:MAG: Uma2 family endonuclease [Cyanobacteria bacterium J06627_32]
MVSSPAGVPSVSQVNRLTQQIQQYLVRHRLERFEVRSHLSIFPEPIGPGIDESSVNSSSVLRPAIALLENTNGQSQVRWAIDIADTWQESDLRSQLYAEAAIAEYWHLSTVQVELRTWTDRVDGAYCCRRLYQVGEQISPAILPKMWLQVQEPLPLYFLTRTTSGHRTYIGHALALQLCDDGLL